MDIHPDFIIANIRERILFMQFQQQQKNFDIQLLTSVTGFDEYDAIIQSGVSKSIVEVKVRPKSMIYDNWFLHQNKFKALTALTSTDKAIKLNTKCLFLNIFDDGVIYWEIDNNQNIQFEDVWVKKTTFASKEMVQKGTAMLKIKDGTVIKYQTNIAQATKDARLLFKCMFPHINID